MTIAQQVDDPYFSRVSNQWEAAERDDPVVWDNVDGPLNATQVEQYERDGYLFLPNLFTQDEVDAMLAEAKSLAADWDPEKPGLIYEPDSDIVRSIFLLHRISDLYRGVFQDGRLLGPARQLLGSEVCMHQSRINYKPPLNGKEFFWHSDFETWHIEDGMPRMRAVSVSLFLTESHEFNGPLLVIPGSHQTYIRCAGRTPENHFEQSLRKQEYGVPSREALEMLVDRGGIVAPKGPAGSAVFFECNTMHGSTGNLSPTPRVNLFAVYNSVENGLVAPFGDRPPRPEFLAEREVIPVRSLSK